MSRRKGVSSIEYALFIAAISLVIAAFLSTTEFDNRFIAALKGPYAIQSIEPSSETYAISGNRFSVDGKEVEITGVMIPDIGLAFQHGAKNFLAGMVVGRSLSCDLTSIDGYEYVGTCAYSDDHTKSAVDIGEMLVRAGFAVSSDPTNRQYVEAEVAAAKQNVGIWSNPKIESSVDVNLEDGGGNLLSAIIVAFIQILVAGGISFLATRHGTKFGAQLKAEADTEQQARERTERADRIKNYLARQLANAVNVIAVEVKIGQSESGDRALVYNTKIIKRADYVHALGVTMAVEISHLPAEQQNTISRMLANIWALQRNMETAGGTDIEGRIADLLSTLLEQIELLSGDAMYGDQQAKPIAELLDEWFKKRLAEEYACRELVERFKTKPPEPPKARIAMRK
ncbi:MAG: thermonuclease family protein [Alphaproteobacteria bacterium]